MRIDVNPDEEYVREIKHRLKSNSNYCPCRLEKSPDTKCMCREFREQIANNEEGYCHCGLYVAVREEE